MPDFETFRTSPFVDMLRSNVTVTDPAQDDVEGRAFLADCDVDRRDIHAVVKFVREKYGLRKPTIRRFVLVSDPV